MITEIAQHTGFGSSFSYQVYLPPTQLPLKQQQPHHSRFELIRTGQVQTELLSNILCRVSVISDASADLSIWLSQVKNSARNKDVQEFYFSRQKIADFGQEPEMISDGKMSLVPEAAKTICICRQILNPDSLVFDGFENLA